MKKKGTRFSVEFNMRGRTPDERAVIGAAFERLMETIYAIDGTAVSKLEEVRS